MSGVAIIRAQILAGSITIPSASIHPVIVPASQKAPCILISSVSNVRVQTASQRESTYLYQERVQVTVFEKSYVKLNAYMDTLKDSLVNVNGIVSGFDVDSIIYQNDNPDGYDEDSEVYVKSMDFMVKFRR